MNEYIGKNILCTVGDNDSVQETTVRKVSPNGQFVLVGSESPYSNLHGWFAVNTVKVLDSWVPNGIKDFQILRPGQIVRVG